MADFLLPYDEDDAVKRILRHHHAQPTRELVADLSTLINWVREVEATKGRFTTTHPPLLITLLSKMGIWGKDYLSKVEQPS